MSDQPESMPPQPGQEAPTVSPPPPAPGVAWYYGPFPPPGAPQEGFGKSLGKTAARGCIWSIAFGMGFLVSIGILVGAIVGIVAAAGDGGGDDGPSKFVYGDKGSSNKLLSIRVEGVILGEKPVHGGGLFSDPNVVYGYEVKKQLLDASRDTSIKGVVIELNTPGGTIFGSQAIADGIKMYRESTGKPVIAYIAGLSASGGVYSMVPATKILADHGSLIGSIGVRLGTIPYYDGVMATEGGLLGGGITTRNGISFTTLTAGRSKDVGSPFRPMTDEEKRVFQQGLDNLYTEFVAHVSKSRSIPEATIREQMGALVFDNATALQYGLIDGTASREESYAELAKLAKLEGQTWRVVRKDEGGGFLGGLLGKGETTPPEASSQGICFPQNMILAYYGEPSALCKR